MAIFKKFIDPFLNTFKVEKKSKNAFISVKHLLTKNFENHEQDKNYKKQLLNFPLKWHSFALNMSF